MFNQVLAMTIYNYNFIDVCSETTNLNAYSFNSSLNTSLHVAPNPNCPQVCMYTASVLLLSLIFATRGPHTLYFLRFFGPQNVRLKSATGLS